MTTFLGIITCMVTLTTTVAVTEPAIRKEVQSPSHQVIAMYFHRTQRCPTCKRIGALGEEAITKGFPSELKSKTVEFRLVDYQDEKNTELARLYQIQGPTLVLLNVFEGKVVSWAAMPKIWQLIAKPSEFYAYVQEQTSKYLKQDIEEAESKE